MNRGLFSEIIKSGKPISRREFKESFLYEPTGHEVEKPVVENAIIFPIKNRAGKVIAILEVKQDDTVVDCE